MRVCPALLVSSLLASFACADVDDPLPDPSRADDAAAECLFGEFWDEWDNGIPDMIIERGWSVFDATSTPWDGAVDQMRIALDFPGGPTDLAGMLAETDDGEFLWRELHDVRRGEDYIAWGYVGGDNFHGAIMPMFGTEVVARLGDPDIAGCKVFPVETDLRCEEGEDESPATATVLAETGQQIEADAFDRFTEGTLVGETDTDWFRVDFKPADECFSCFQPYAFVDEPEAVDEVCVYVANEEIDARGGAEPECFNGASSRIEGFTGCCTSDVEKEVVMSTDWNHEYAGDSSDMYIMVRSDSANTCTPYGLIWGHFRG